MLRKSYNFIGFKKSVEYTNTLIADESKPPGLPRRSRMSALRGACDCSCPMTYASSAAAVYIHTYIHTYIHM